MTGAVHSVLRSTFLEVIAADATVLGDTDTHLTNEAMPSEATANRTPSKCISIFLFLYQYHKPVPDTITPLSLTLLSRGHTLSINFYYISVFFVLRFCLTIALFCFLCS